MPFLRSAIESIASPTIRNLATVGGNLFVPQPHGDLAVCLLALDATVEHEGDLVTGVSFKVPERWFYTKAMRRKQNSASIVTVASDGVRIALGGVAPRAGARARGRGGARERRHRGRRAALASRPPTRSTTRSPAPGTAAASFPSTSAGPLPMPSSVIELEVNGEPREFLAAPGTTLLSALRETLGLTAAKRGCAQGTCGTCTCHLDGAAVMSCLVPGGDDQRRRACTTLEGTTPAEGLSPLQQAFLDGFATQCGFCTPGMIMAAEALLAENPDPTREDVVRAISGNVCRCTGYESIINAILDAAGKR